MSDLCQYHMGRGALALSGATLLVLAEFMDVHEELVTTMGGSQRSYNGANRGTPSALVRLAYVVIQLSSYAMIAIATAQFDNSELTALVISLACLHAGMVIIHELHLRAERRKQTTSSAKGALATLRGDNGAASQAMLVFVWLVAASFIAVSVVTGIEFTEEQPPPFDDLTKVLVAAVAVSGVVVQGTRFRASAILTHVRLVSGGIFAVAISCLCLLIGHGCA